MSFKPFSPDAFPAAGQANGSLRQGWFVQIPGYEIEGEIGRGGMATVYHAVQHSLSRVVAIKVLARGPDDQDEFARRFKKEGRILASLLHPNIVTIYDIGVSEDNQLFLSMEYLSGGTLRDRIKLGLSFDSALHIIRAIAKALGYAHEKGVVHRDVKPSNIMFRHDGTPVLTDFGVARVVAAAGLSTVHTLTGLTVGSPGYMSPEQAMGQSATIQSDLYSLGVVLYEMLTGYPPYQADHALAVLLQHLHDPIPSLPRKHANLQPILNKLLAKKPAGRYRDIGEFLAALHRIIPSDTGSQPKATTGGAPLAVVEFASGTLRNWLRRGSHRSRWLGIIGVTLLLVGGGYAFWPRNAPEKVVVLPEASPPSVANPVPVSREAEIATLLQQAETHLQAGLLTDEAEQTAEAAYRRVLKLDQGNAQALAGLENIAREYERLARQRLEAGALRESLDPIQKGLAVAPGREGLLRLRQEAEQRIAERQAQQAEQERQQQLQLQAEQFLEQARSSLAEGLLEISRAHIEQGLLAVPDHPDLLALREQVKARLAEQARQREEEARRQVEEAERRKTEQARQQAAAAQQRREADQSLARAVEARQKNDYAASSQFIEQGLEQAPNHEGLLRLREKVAQEVAAAKARQEREEEQRLHAELFFAQARSHFQQGALEASLTQIEQGLAVAPSHPGLLALREQVKARMAEQARQQAEAQRRQEEEAQRQAEEAKRQQVRQVEQAKREQEITVLLEQAEAQFKARRLTEPAGNNAEATYRQVLKLDASNVPAQAGLERIAQDYLQQARQRQSAGALQESLKLIEQGLAVLPKQAELLRLREEISAQRAAEQQNLKQQRLEQQQQDKQRQEEKQRQEQQRREQQQLERQRQEERQREQQRKLEQQRQEEKQRQEQQKKLEQQRLEQQRLEQQRKEQQRKEQQRLEQQRQEEKQRLEQQRKLEQQRQEEKQRQEQPRKLEPQRQEQPFLEQSSKPGWRD